MLWLNRTHLITGLISELAFLCGQVVDACGVITILRFQWTLSPPTSSLCVANFSLSSDLTEISSRESTSFTRAAFLGRALRSECEHNVCFSRRSFLLTRCDGQHRYRNRCVHSFAMDLRANTYRESVRLHPSGSRRRNRPWLQGNWRIRLRR